MKINCFHGTIDRCWKKIQKENKFSITDNGWFGNGIYFYMNDLKMARFWCKKKLSNAIYSILNIVIEIDEKFIFDVRDPYGKDAKLFHRERANIIKKLKYDINSTSIRLDGSYKNIDNMILNIICRIRNKKLVLANSFTYDDNKYDAIKYISRIPNATEVCIIDSAIININEVIEL
jgi:hypothetical protein